MRSITLFSASLFLILGSGISHGSEIKRLEVTPIPSIDATKRGNESIGKMVYRGGVEIEAVDTRFGGFSSLYVKPGTDEFLSVSDVAYRMTGRLLFNQQGMLVGLEGVDLEPLLDESGVRFDGKTNRDAEAITSDGEGGVLVAFERNHRIVQYAGLAEGNAKPFPAPQGLLDAPKNGGAEAMTRLSDGRLLVMTEDYKGDDAGMRRAWVGADGRWIDFHYVVFDGYEPTDAALSPDGKYVYVLERAYTPVIGARARIRRFLQRELRSGARIVGELMGEMGLTHVTDNFEGISVVEKSDGGVRVYIISDDNFGTLQDTYLLAFDVEMP